MWAPFCDDYFGDNKNESDVEFRINYLVTILENNNKVHQIMYDSKIKLNTQEAIFEMIKDIERIINSKDFIILNIINVNNL